MEKARDPTGVIRRMVIIAILALFSAGLPARAQFLADADEHPLKLGDAAPKFELEDSSGTDRSLEAALDKSKVALVFYRSADW